MLTDHPLQGEVARGEGVDASEGAHERPLGGPAPDAPDAAQGGDRFLVAHRRERCVVEVASERGLCDAEHVLGFPVAQLECAHGLEARFQQRLRAREGVDDVAVQAHLGAVLRNEAVAYHARHNAGDLLPDDGVDERLPHRLGARVAQSAQFADRTGEDGVVREHLVEAVHGDIETEQPRDPLRCSVEGLRRTAVRE